ncbi:MAG: carbon starvation CstA family protein [Verrucomicrobiales bacterium]|nr:carbon starvation CstA family protein [Verrucomicrobiales bacterium]
MKSALSTLFWVFLALLGGWAFSVLAFGRGDHVNSLYILISALCTYAIGFRFYSKWLAAKVLMLDDRRATPSEVHDDGKDFVRTNKWIVFGHHFAAISGPGPLVGPVLASQFGYLPGTLWILVGVVLGGAVQDFIILFASMRRDGKSLGQMVKEELNSAAGMVAMISILGIMIILLAVLALVIVNALAESPWGVFTVGATVPIAMFMGGYLRYVRIGKVAEASFFGVVLLLAAVWFGQYVHEHESWSRALTLSKMFLAVAIIVYGFFASVLPVWLLLAPRDYLSTFMKLGTIIALALGVFLVLPDLKMPAISKFVDGSGLVVPGKIFPFCFITIACGAISGFHSLISSGTTPKMITRESYSRHIGYGAMCLESLVAIMALIAACTLDPGVYLSMNVAGVGPDAEKAIVAKVTAAGIPVSVEQMHQLAEQVHEKTLFGRTGGAATLAVGMASIFSKVTHGRWLDIWYHFAIMFEALFILTTLDAGTRVGRYLLQDFLVHVWKPLADVKNGVSNVFASALMVASWGVFLIQGVIDPDGGVKALWPLFGIANQLLASIALCLATTILLKMQLNKSNPRLRITLVTLIPLCWLLAVTMTAGVQKIFHHESRPAFPRIGFLQIADELNVKLPALERVLEVARNSGEQMTIDSAAKALRSNRILHFNNCLDAVITGLFLAMVLFLVVLCLREWVLLVARKKASGLRESAPAWLKDYEILESKHLQVTSLIALVIGLTRELTAEGATERALAANTACICCEEGGQIRVNLSGSPRETPGSVYAAVLEEKYSKPNRCC